MVNQNKCYECQHFAQCMKLMLKNVNADQIKCVHDVKGVINANTK